MMHCLQLEVIGDDMRFAPFPLSMLRTPPPWVAEITGRDPRYGLAREFLEGDRDYSLANRDGSRGVYLYFILRPGKVYEVNDHCRRYRWDRYFCRLGGDYKPVRMTREEVLAWLDSREG